MRWLWSLLGGCRQMPVAPWLVLIAVGMAFCSQRSHAESPPADEPLPERVSFNRDIRPIFASECVACHGGVKRASGLSLIYREQALAEADSGEQAIVPGDLEASHLLERVADSDPDYRMPPGDHGPPLPSREVALLKKWIEQGAEWEEHWSFVPPERHNSPELGRPDWCRSTIDAFVLARLESEGLAPSPEATRAAWLRRATFDVTGLPPSEKELAEFLADDREDAYEQATSRLLASPHFGERWTAMWLDLARYSDTMGFEKDPHRDMWPYRDWLIRALDADMPYNEFIVKQLAGDLLPHATIDDKVATGLHRNTQSNTEGGTDDEEFRTAAVLDRVNSTWQIVAGLTYGCTQCHSHPYDPIEHEEYYKFVAVFNSSRDADLDDESPRLAVPRDATQREEAQKLDDQISALRQSLHARVVSLAKSTQWHPMAFDQVKSTGLTQLTTHVDPVGNVPEVLAGGTPTAHSQFTLSGPVPKDVSQVTALRIDALPKDLEAALRIPEMGFALTRLVATVEIPGEELPRELRFVAAYCDEAEPLYDPESSLEDNNTGWSAFTKMDRPHWAVFVLAEPVELPAGTRLKLVLKQERTATGNIALLFDRSRYALASNAEWNDLVSRDEFVTDREQLATAKEARNKMDSVRMPVMEEMPASQRRKTYIFERGNWLTKGDEVLPGVPAVFPPLEGEANRLTVARWFTSGNHPLTARVAVNRVWEQVFGIGLVETVGDFGSSGQKPSHPQLLDDLAVRYQTEMGWSLKTLLRELILSATYRQSTRVSAELVARDPRNRLLSRGPRLRLSAEMVRDQALVLSGHFSPKRLGPSVMPPQPEGIWRTVYSGAQWKTAEGKDRYRRAIYTYWRRTSPYPSMTTFDTPSREVCTVQRLATNTPLQALVTLNDPAYIECAQGLAERMTAREDATPQEQIEWAYQLATGELGSPKIIGILVSLYNDGLEKFDANDEGILSLGATAEAYALSLVANAILNLDDVLTR